MEIDKTLTIGDVNSLPSWEELREVYDTWVTQESSRRDGGDAQTFVMQMQNRRRGKSAYTNLKKIAAQAERDAANTSCYGKQPIDSSHNSRLNSLLKIYSERTGVWKVDGQQFYPVVGENDVERELFSLKWASDVPANSSTKSPPKFEIVSVVVRSDDQSGEFSEQLKEFVNNVKGEIADLLHGQKGQGSQLDNDDFLFYWLFEQNPETGPILAKVARTILDAADETTVKLRVAFSAEVVEFEKQFEPMFARSQPTTLRAIETLDSFAEFANSCPKKLIESFVLIPADEFQNISMDFVGEHVMHEPSFEVVHIISDTRPNFVKEEEVLRAIESLPAVGNRMGVCCRSEFEQDFWAYALGRWALKRIDGATILHWECHVTRSDELLFPVHESLRKLIGLGFVQDGDETISDPHQRHLLSWLLENVTRAHVPTYLQVLEVFLLGRPIEDLNVKKVGLFLSGLLEELSKANPLVIIVSDLENADPATKELLRALLKVKKIVLLATSKLPIELADFDLDVLENRQAPSFSQPQYKQLFKSLSDDEKAILRIARCLEWNSLRSWVRNIWLNSGQKRKPEVFEKCVNRLMRKKLLRTSGRLKDYWNTKIYRELRFSSREIFAALHQFLGFDLEASRLEIMQHFEQLLVTHLSDKDKDARSVRQKFQVLRYLDILEPKSIDPVIVEYLPDLCLIVAKRFNGYAPKSILDRLRTVRAICFREGQNGGSITLTQRYSIVAMALVHVALNDPEIETILEEAKELHRRLEELGDGLNSQVKFRYIRAFWAFRFKRSEYEDAFKLAHDLRSIVDNDPVMRFSFEHCIEANHVFVVTAFFSKKLEECIKEGASGKEAFTPAR